jgi:hypothetical protein
MFASAVYQSLFSCIGNSTALSCGLWDAGGFAPGDGLSVEDGLSHGDEISDGEEFSHEEEFPGGEELSDVDGILLGVAVVLREEIHVTVSGA